MDPRKYYDHPLSNQQRIDLWYTTICKTTNANLSSFFEIWKIPVSEKAKAEMHHYKTWIPQEFVTYLPH